MGSLIKKFDLFKQDKNVGTKFWRLDHLDIFALNHQLFS